VTTLQITLDEDAVQAIRCKAQLAGKTPEAWVAEAAAQKAGSPGNKDWIRKFLENADKVRGNSGGQKWTRDELYER
jgi:hypothetical protein